MMHLELSLEHINDCMEDIRDMVTKLEKTATTVNEKYGLAVITARTRFVTDYINRKTIEHTEELDQLEKDMSMFRESSIK